MNAETKKKILKIARFILITGLVAAGIYIFLNYLLGWFLPFIIAWFIALLIQPVVQFFNTKLKIPRKPATILFLLILFVALGFVIFLAIDRVVYELTLLSKNFSLTDSTNIVSNVINNFFEQLENTLGNIPLFTDANIIENIRDIITTETGNIISKFSSNIVSQIPTIIKSIVVTIPQTLVYTLITIISTFYIALDYRNINKAIALQIPEKARNVIIDIKSRFFDAIYKYLKAYSVIFLIAYSELTVGFLIIGIKYAFLIAFIVAVIDILPVLGTGTVLIPWGIIAIFQKDYFTGFALLILYAAITVIRNIIEPKIVGSNLGLYPVITLIAIFVGYNIMGFAGIVMFPVTILILKNLNDEGKIHIWKYPPKTEEEKEQEQNKKDKKEKKNKKEKRK